MTPLDPDSRKRLHRHGVSNPAIEAALLMIDDIIDAGDDVVRDTGSESFDDATSKGQLHYWRARNRMSSRFQGNPTITCDETDNAFQIHVDGIKISFYSARNGIDQPNVTGSPTKKRVVDEFQMMLELDDQPQLRRLVLLHERGNDGVTRVALGVLSGAHTWRWRVTLYDRFTMDESTDTSDRGPAYDELPEAELPPMDPREDIDEQDEGSADSDPA